MPRTAPTTSTTTSRLVPALLVLAVLASLLSVSVRVDATAAVAERPRGAHRSSGYAVAHQTRWVGSYTVGTRGAYRLQPYRAVRGRYGKAYRRPVDSTRWSRAAYVLSRYGARGGPAQAAAVDAAVLHLYSSPDFNLDGRNGRARVRQVGADRGVVRSYARQMLRSATRLAGPYRVSLTTSGAADEATGVVVTYRILSATGHPIVTAPVRFQYADDAPVTVYTDKDGVARLSVNAKPGTLPVSAVAQRLPDWNLVYRSPVPRTRARSTVALAGVTRDVAARTTITGVGTQTATIANAASLVRSPQPIRGTYTVTGGTGERRITFGVYGPTSTASAGCAGVKTAYQSFGTASGSSSAGVLPAYSPRSGWYRWSIAVDGNESTRPATGCGAPVRVQTQARVRQVREQVGGGKVKPGKPTSMQVVVDGFDRPESHTLTARLYGPFNTFDAARCTGPSRPVNIAISNNGKYNVSTVLGRKQLDKFFVWQTTLSTGQLIVGATTGCGLKVKVTDAP